MIKIKYLLSSNYIFCLNKLSFEIAKKYAITNRDNVILIYDQRRINLSENNYSFLIFKYCTYIGILILLVSLFNGVKITIPHCKSGKILWLLTKFSKNLNFIDDGLDTYRNIPANLNPLLIRDNSFFLTYAKQIILPEWTNLFEHKIVSKLNDLFGNNISHIFSQHDNIIIESPGINSKYLKNLCINSTCLVKHPNVIKNQEFQHFETFVNINNLEKEIINSNCSVYIGESLLLVFLLLNYPKCLLNVSLMEDSYQNLTCLHSLLGECNELHIW